MKFVLASVILLFRLSFPFKINAQSPYVLPYPSFMLGNPFYKISLIKDEILRYWYFGNFGQFKYNLKMSDKYLVESKTLFEYSQYLLGYKALLKSDFYFSNTLPNLVKADKNNKNTAGNRLLLKKASLKHIEVLKKINGEVPENYLWQPEKGASTYLKLRKTIEKSISIRQKYL